MHAHSVCSRGEQEAHANQIQSGRCPDVRGGKRCDDSSLAATLALLIVCRNILDVTSRFVITLVCVWVKEGCNIPRTPRKCATWASVRHPVVALMAPRCGISHRFDLPPTTTPNPDRFHGYRDKLRCSWWFFTDKSLRFESRNVDCLLSVQYPEPSLCYIIVADEVMIRSLSHRVCIFAAGAEKLLKTSINSNFMAKDSVGTHNS